jgi:hypothetical protein
LNARGCIVADFVWASTEQKNCNSVTTSSPGGNMFEKLELSQQPGAMMDG